MHKIRGKRKEDPTLRSKLDTLVAKIAKETDGEKKKTLEQARAEILDELFKRNVGVYGAINLRTDGRQAVVAFRREPSNGTKRWFSYELEKDSNGIFQVQDVNGH
ncbi:MAG: DUF2089 domain-containing protein [Nitrospirota bacterium]|nr:DUF2089 domain-containing protein [Nitrospirota bacterium]